MALVLSPSNMNTYRDCPLRFYGQSLAKDIPYRASTSKARGMTVHSDIEKCMRLGWQDDISWDSTINLTYARSKVQEAYAMRATHDLFVEHELAINKAGNKCGWWDEDGLLRAKADAIMLPRANCPQPVARLIDIKTGKKWDDDDFQLRVEALLAHIIYQVPIVHYEYWYVDTGQTVWGDINFAEGLTPVQDIYDLMHDMLQSIKMQYFPRQPNKFCKWCAYYKTEKCR